MLTSRAVSDVCTDNGDVTRERKSVVVADLCYAGEQWPLDSFGLNMFNLLVILAYYY